MVEGTCLSSGEVTSVQGVGHFCSGTELVAQIESGACEVDAACITGQCVEGSCVEPEKPNVFSRVISWFTGLF